MATKLELANWVIEALESYGGSATIVQVAKYIWEKYEGELKASGDLFYTWQYDFRWAANYLRRNKVMKSVESSAEHRWELAPKSQWASAAKS